MEGEEDRLPCDQKDLQKEPRKRQRTRKEGGGGPGKNLNLQEGTNSSGEGGEGGNREEFRPEIDMVDGVLKESTHGFRSSSP